MALKPFSIKSALISFTIVLLIAQTSVAQYGRRVSADYNSWEIGFSGGVSRFLNTINPNSGAIYKKYNYWNADFDPAISLSVIKNFSPKFSAEAEWLTTKLSGSWNPLNGYPVPSLATKYGLDYPNPFKTGINQFNLLFAANLNKIIAPNLINENWNLFVNGGGGLVFLKQYSALYTLGNHSPAKYAILLGGGMSYQFNEKLKLKLGANWITVKSDRLDGVQARNEADTDNLYNVNDKYLYSYIGITYGLSKPTLKAHFSQRARQRFIWFKSSSKKYKSRRR